jgi:hypothetical protein
VFFFCGVGLSPLGTAATSALLYKPQMIDDGDCGAIDGMKIGKENRSTWRKPDPAPLCPPQIPHDQTRARTRAADLSCCYAVSLMFKYSSKHSVLRYHLVRFP